MIDMKEIDIDLIKPYKNNPREISAEAVQKVMKSIKEFGYNSPIVVDKDHVILAGHTRWKAMKQLGKKKANIIVRDLTKEQAVAYRIMDNRSGEESKWQNKLLAEELNVLQDSTFDLDLTGFNATELENLANDKELGFIQNEKELKENLNVEFPDNMQVTHVKMVQLFLNTETEKNFKIWCTELQKQLKTDNLTDTVYEVIKNAYDNSKT
jgi:ParB-like chromosome segregation protein Spo0J